MRRIRISSQNVELTAKLNDSNTSDMIWQALPITGKVQTWGDEIYFPIPIHAEKEDATAAEVVDEGTIAYWPPGNALCLFWGPTPVSQGDEIRPASIVNVCGKIEGNAQLLNNATNGAEIVIEKADDD